MSRIFATRRTTGARSHRFGSATGSRRYFSYLAAGGLALGLSANVHAAPLLFDVSTTTTLVDGSFVGGIPLGTTINGSFVFDTDETNALPGAITTPSTNPGHEFTSFYEFDGVPYGVSLSIPAISGSFGSTTPLAVVVNDNLPLSAAETGGLIADGTYDWIELLGSTTVSVCLMPGGVCQPDEFSPADGQEWTLAIIGDAGWFSDGSVIPDSFPALLTALLVG
ncbi:MAG: hypothetical protein ACE5G3_06440, partial [Gammaproteobacteria bacterium]